MYALESHREAVPKIGPDFYLATNESPSPWAALGPFPGLAGSTLTFGSARDSRHRMRTPLSEAQHLAAMLMISILR